MSNPTDPPPIAAGPQQQAPPAVQFNLVPFGDLLMVQITSTLLFDRDGARRVGEAIVAASEALPRIRVAGAVPRIITG